MGCSKKTLFQDFRFFDPTPKSPDFPKIQNPQNLTKIDQNSRKLTRFLKIWTPPENFPTPPKIWDPKPRELSKKRLIWGYFRPYFRTVTHPTP